MPRNIKIVTLGCPKNTVDSEQIMGALYTRGYCFTEDPAKADVIVINTCGFIEEAKRESIETILELSHWKEKGKCKYLVAAGCLVQKYSLDLYREIPEVDLFIGVSDIPLLPDLLEKMPLDRPKPFISDPDRFLYDEKLTRANLSHKHYAYLKIAEGCDNCCTYCVIPSMRGSYRSRSMPDILNEARILTEQGVKELILVAQDTSNYGRDLYADHKLTDLLRELVKLPRLHWVRLLYAYPDHINDDLLQIIEKENKICSYLDIPLQHISRHILEDMGRSMSSQEIITLLTKIRRNYPKITLRSTFIVGFPGETRADFNDLQRFLQEFKLERAGFFAYSREPETPAAAMPGQVPEKIKVKRLEQITRLQADIMAQKQEELIGRILTVIVDGPSADYEGLWEGRTEGDAPEIDGVVYFKAEKAQPGDFLQIKVTHSQEFLLMGEINNGGNQA